MPPTKEHAELVKRANKLGLTGKRKKAYIFGTLNQIKKRRTAKRKRQAAKRKRKRPSAGRRRTSKTGRSKRK